MPLHRVLFERRQLEDFVQEAQIRLYLLYVNVGYKLFREGCNTTSIRMYTFLIYSLHLFFYFRCEMSCKIFDLRPEFV